MSNTEIDHLTALASKQTKALEVAFETVSLLTDRVRALLAINAALVRRLPDIEREAVSEVAGGILAEQADHDRAMAMVRDLVGNLERTADDEASSPGGTFQ